MAWRRPGDKPLSEPMIYASLGLNELSIYNPFVTFQMSYSDLAY